MGFGPQEVEIEPCVASIRALLSAWILAIYPIQNIFPLQSDTKSDWNFKINQNNNSKRIKRINQLNIPRTDTWSLRCLFSLLASASAIWAWCPFSLASIISDCISQIHNPLSIDFQEHIINSKQTGCHSHKSRRCLHCTTDHISSL